jgi:hypothetical protein
MNVTIESLSKSLGNTESETMDILVYSGMDINTITFFDVVRLVGEFQSYRLSKTKPYRTFLIPKETLLRYIDGAFAPLYKKVSEKYQYQCAQCQSSDRLNVHHVDCDHAHMKILKCFSFYTIFLPRINCWTTMED